MTTRPVIDVDFDHPEQPSVDRDGTEWVQALVNTDGEVLAGYTKAGDFRSFGSKEEIFDLAMACITQALDIATHRRDQALDEIGEQS